MQTQTLLDNRYRIIRTLGSGGFGETFLAEDTQMPSGRRCVIKQLKPVANNPQVYQIVKDRFAREAAILEDLGEANSQIPKLYAYFSEGGQFYLVEEWVEGEPLGHKLETSGLWSESSVKALLVSILPVLDYVHSKRIVHRDIKPDNIMLRQRDGLPVLIDFGAVKETMGTVVTSSGNTTSSIVIGTPGFMPSEQAAGRPVYSSDLYALSLTAIYLLTGKIPQDLETDPRSGEIVWRHHAPLLSPTLAGVLEKAIQSHPRDRYASAREMLEALQAGATPIAPTIPVPPIPTPIAPTIAAQPVSPLPPTVHNPPIEHYSHSVLTPTPPSGLGDWQKAAIVGGVIGASVIVGLMITRPQPVPPPSPSPLSTTAQQPSAPTPVTAASKPTENPPSATRQQYSPAAASITQQEAVSLIESWLQAKRVMFAPPYSRQPVGDLTTGALYADLMKYDGPISWLQNNNSYYQFGVQKIEGVDNLVSSGNSATFEVRVTEDRTLYNNGQIDENQTDFKTRRLIYTLQFVDGKWKIADYR